MNGRRSVAVRVNALVREIAIQGRFHSVFLATVLLNKIVRIADTFSCIPIWLELASVATNRVVVQFGKSVNGSGCGDNRSLGQNTHLNNLATLAVGISTECRLE